MHDHEDDEDEDETPEWPFRWTTLLVLPLVLIHDIFEALTDFVGCWLIQAMAVHNRGVTRAVFADTVREAIENLPQTPEEPLDPQR